MNLTEEYNKKTQIFREENENLKIIDFDFNQGKIDLFKKTKDEIENADYIICEKLPIEIFDYINDEVRDIIINKGINIKINHKKKYNLGFLFGLNYKIMEKINLNEIFSDSSIKFIFGIKEDTIDQIFACEKLVVFLDDSLGNNLHNILSRYTGKIEIYGLIPIPHTIYYTHFSFIEVKEKHMTSVRENFKIIKDSISNLKSITRTEHNVNNGISILEFKDIYKKAYDLNPNFSNLDLFDKNDKSIQVNSFIEESIRDIFKNKSIIERIDELLTLTQFEVFYDSLCQFRVKNSSPLIDSVILFCYLLIFAKKNFSESFTNTLIIDKVDYILKYYNHQYTTKDIVGEFDLLSNIEKDYNGNYNAPVKSKFIKYFYPNIFDVNSSELIFYLKLEMYFNKKIFHTDFGEKYKNILNKFILSIENNFHKELTFEVLIILVNFDKSFFVNNIKKLIDIRLAFDLCMLLSIEENIPEVNLFILNKFNKMDDNISDDRLYLFSIYKFYLEKHLKLEIDWKGSNKTVEIIKFIQKINEQAFPFKHIPNSPFHIALFSFFLESHKMTDEFEFLVHQFKTRKQDISKYNYYASFLKTQ